MKRWLFLIVPVVLLFGAVLWVSREQPAPVVPIPDNATDVLDDPRFAEPEDWATRELKVEGAGTVRIGLGSQFAPSAVVVFFPGYSAPLNIYYESFARLMDEGYAVVGIDWPSQGGSSRPLDNPQKIHATSLDPHVAAGQAAIRTAREVYPDLPVFVVGLSMGAQLGTRVLGSEDGESVTAAALITPAYGLYGDRPNPIEEAMLGMLQGMGLGERYAPGTTDWSYDLQAHNLEASDCSHPNARTRLWYSWMVADPALRVGGLTNDFLVAMLESGNTAASVETLGRLSLPVWMPLAENDTFVDNAKSEAACAALSNCEGKVYAEARHCLFEEADDYYHPFMNDLITFLERHTPEA
ncbi:MAG: alpha/beta hydrolase [Pseudomonadota bacterium]